MYRASTSRRPPGPLTLSAVKLSRPRSRPLTSHDVVINSIAATTTRTGLTVQARLDDGTYPTGVKVSNAQMAALPISRHPFHGDWNYTLHPAAGHTAGPPAGNDQERPPPSSPS
jgi:hypothetical protein